MLVTGRKLPIGIQTFEDIRNDGYLYVDKTALMWTIANIGKPFFLSRPRRFGKSLLISTFEAYFKGRRDLFTGLAVEQLEKKWEEYPVLHLDLNAEKYDSPDRLDAILSNQLTQWEVIYGKGEDETTLSSRFLGVIRRASEQAGRGVVVLVDEYDKPLLQAIQNEPLLDSYRSTLKAFYGVLKSADRYLRFAFLTGVTKFSQVSVFSDLNQLNDISLNYDFSTLCGITREELLANFEPEIAALSQANDMSTEEVVETMTRQYDGYHFHPNGEGVFNPFSVLNAFFSKEFGNYWFQTGTPTFLVELLKESDYDLRLLMDGIETAASAFTEYRADRKNPIPLIYQSGYLTIKGYDEEFGMYRLGFPNREVEEGFVRFLLPYYANVNKVESGVRLRYIWKNPNTGIAEEILIECTETRDQPKNKERALARLRTFIYDKEHQKYIDDIASKRKTMVSTGDRSAKIRTYNYPQGRITDHRINYTIYNLAAFMDGDIQDCIDHLIVAENAERLKESEL